jgi:hypothetical protein
VRYVELEVPNPAAVEPESPDDPMTLLGGD